MIHASTPFSSLAAPWRRLSLLGLLVAGLWTSGCRQDARLAGHDVREVEVGTVSAYGLTLDESATPKQVTYVLLQAVADDYAAGGDRQARKAAFDIQLSLSAPDRIAQGSNGPRLSDEQRRERVYSAVWHWAPVLGSCHEGFRGDYEKLADEMFVIHHPKQAGLPEQAEVYVNCPAHDEDSESFPGAVARIFLAKEKGYWRIWWVGWENTSRNWKTDPPEAVVHAQRAARRTRPAPTPPGDPSEPPASPSTQPRE